MANVNTVDVLKNEARQIEKQIGHLTEQHKVLNQTISFFTHPLRLRGTQEQRSPGGHQEEVGNQEEDDFDEAQGHEQY
jgi:hypothetical protein